MNQEPVYEMLWDCRHCGAKKLLGLTHRYCPECGSPQNAEFRYFPAEQDKIAVQNHVYAGADIVCRYCNHYNGRNAKHCKDCGGPLVEGAAAQVRQDQVHAIGQFQGENIQHAMQERQGGLLGAQPAQSQKKKKAPVLLILLGLGMFVVVTLGLVAAFWKRDAAFTVQGHSWEREIDVEVFGPVKGSAWCNELPNAAKNVRKYSAVRDYEQVQVGENCQTRKVDNGDGTFGERQECTPKYEKKPINDDKCDFTVDKWSRGRTLTAKGAAPTPDPNWPAVTLSRPGCSTLGCEREGPRREKYVVVFKNVADGETGECDFDEAKWKSYQQGANFNAEVGVIGSWLDCDTLAGK